MSTSTSATSTAEPGQALKAKHRAMWALGDYPAVATDLVASLGPVLVGACEIRPGDRVLDVAAGTGNAAIPAARAGASVVASDLTPELLEAGRRHAEQQGIPLEWRQADAEDLPFADGEFDTVMSCLGVMFAPYHQASADELVRVCRPGGTIGLLNWTPEGFIGQLFATMKPYAPPPPAGAQPPPLWGREDHVRALLGD
jgi:ubiquinone/menaquinone biosynthesis C-methylase UbiE